MQSLSNIEAFVGSAETGSFTKAARRLGLTASAVSRRIARLEEELKVSLFYRTTRALRLTEDGRAFHERCKRVLDELEDAKRTLGKSRSRPAGKLHVHALQVLGQRVLLPALPAFLSKYPDIELRLTLRDQLVDPAMEGVDVLLRMGPLSDTRLIARKLGVARMVVCASPGYLRKHGVPKTPAELLKHGCVGFMRDGVTVPWNLKGLPLLEVKGAFHVNHGASLREAALGGLGLAWLPDFMVASDLARGDLKQVLQDYAVEERPLHALYLPNRHLLPRVRAFLDFVVALFPSHSTEG